MNESNNEAFDETGDFTEADRNVERLLRSAYQPEPVAETFAERVRLAMHAAAAAIPATERPSTQQGGELVAPATEAPPPVWKLAIAAAIAASVIFALFSISRPGGPRPVANANGTVDGAVDGAVTVPVVPATDGLWAKSTLARGLRVDRYVRPKESLAIVEPPLLALGESLETGDRQHKWARLPDGSVVWLNESSIVRLNGDRRLSLDRGEAFIEVAPRSDVETSEKETPTFIVATPDRNVTALGTKFVVRVEPNNTDVLVAQGKVAVEGAEKTLTVGEQLSTPRRGPTSRTALTASQAPRITAAIDWARDLYAAASPPLVPVSDHAGGALLVKDAEGQEVPLSMRKYHVDVHIEDGFARTTIDQTYFNHLPSRQEGTFFFPLPADASISRLAMYVAGKLMEGGMAERQHAAQVFESIKRKMLDPALLEWIDGTTFRMRVFPLEGREEKRIVLSYTQRLPSLYGKATYRFPAGHNLGTVGLWSARVHVDNAANVDWRSTSHTFAATEKNDELTLTTVAKDASLDRDIVVELTDAASGADDAAENDRREKTIDRAPQFATAEHEKSRYYMFRQRPELSRTARRERRDWILLVETSADRDPLLARAQIEVARGVLEHVEHDDTFTILTASAGTKRLTENMPNVSAKNVRDAIAQLEDTQLLGALDLSAALATVEPIAAKCGNPYLVHLGGGHAVLGEREQAALVDAMPARTKYIGIGVGKRWNRALMKLAASETGGYFTQINPDENIAWRALDLVSTLNAPRLLDVKVNDNAGRTWLAFDDAVADGEEVCAVVRLDAAPKNSTNADAAADAPAPKSVTISGKLDGQPYERSYQLDSVAGNIADNAGYLPRMWAKLEIDRLVAENAAAHKERITELSMAMYVMSPFTSLLVLENEAMYAEYKVDRGRKDHWAMYPCPEKIEVVRDPLPTIAQADKQGLRPDGEPTTEFEAKLAEVNAKTLSAYQSVHIEPRFLASYGVDARNLGRRSSVVRYRLADGTLREKTVNYTLAMGHPQFRSGPNGNVALPYLTTFGRPSRTAEGIDFGYKMAAGIDRFAVNKFHVARQIETLGERQLGLPWNVPVYVDAYRDGGMPFAENAPVAYPNAAFWMDLTERREQLATVNFGDVDYERYYRQLGQGHGVVPLYEHYDDYGFDGRGVIDGLSRTPMHWAWTSVPVMRRTAGSPPLALWSTRPLDIAPKTGQVAWLRLPPTSFASSFDVNGDSLATVLYDRLAFAQQRVRPGDFAIVGSRRVQDFGEDRAIKLMHSVDFGFWGADFDGDGPPLDYWFEPGWPSNRFENEFKVERLARTAGEIRDLIRGERRVLRDIESSATDDNLDVTTLRGPVRFEYIDELDKLVVTGSPRDTETVLQLIRELDESGVSRDELLFAGVESKSRRRRGRGGQAAGFVGKYAAGQMPSGPAYPGEKVNLVRQPPTFAPLSTFVRSASSLVGYAPGMYTTAADVQAVLEDEVREQRPTLGKIDSKARKLIDRARSRGWQRVTIPLTAPREPMEILVDGQGRHRYTRHTEHGLGEQVVCDGQHQWRLYDELGVGAKRELSRYHRAEIEMLVPWLVPMAEDLAVAGDVVSVDERTVAVVREVEWEVLKVAFDRDVNAEATEAAGLTADDVAAGGKVAKLAKIDAAKIDVEKILAGAERETRTTRYELRLVLADDGRMTERQWLIDGRLLLKVTYAADGRIVWRDAEGELLAERKLDVRPASAPTLAPDERRLVVLPLPWRRWGTGPTAELKKNKALDYANYTDDEAMAALSAFLVENDASAVQNLIARRYFGSPEQIRGKRAAADRRLGFYMILSLAGCNWQPDSLVAVGGVVEKKIAAAPLADHPDSPMAWLLARELADRKIGHAEPPAMPEISASRVDRSLAATLLTLRRLYPADDPATETVETAPDQVAANVLRHWQTAHAFVRNTRSPMLAMAVLQTMKTTAGKSGKSWERIALSYERWQDSPAWSDHARYEAARAWFRSGDRRRAEAELSSWHAAQIDAGRLPLVDDDFRMTFYGPNDELPHGNSDPLANEFARKLLGAAKKFTAEGRGAAAMLVAWQAYQLNHSALGDAILNRTLAALPSDEADAAKFAAIAVLYHIEQWERADKLLTPLLDDQRFAEVTPLWLLAADLAERRGRIASSVARWERVAELEYERLGENYGEEYEVAAARQPYEALMQRYEKLVTATTESSSGRLSGEAEPPAGLVARVVRAADRWRTLDNDATAACMAAAKVLSTLGDDELAWQYATTPLVQQDAAAAPYESIAQQLAARGAVELALRAFDAAASADRGNAKLFWDRAKLLESHGRFGEARESYRRVADGQWPAEHADLKRQAAERLSLEAE